MSLYPFLSLCHPLNMTEGCSCEVATPPRVDTNYKTLADDGNRLCGQAQNLIYGEQYIYSLKI